MTAKFCIMMLVNKKDKIETFLKKIKKIINKNCGFVFVPRRKNLRSLNRYGISIAEAKNEILNLKIKNYYDGPLEDNNPAREGHIWIFKTNICNENFYIKLKIDTVENFEVLKCLSFHVDENKED